jgi:hypothetical protein
MGTRILHLPSSRLPVGTDGTRRRWPGQQTRRTAHSCRGSSATSHVVRKILPSTTRTEGSQVRDANNTTVVPGGHSLQSEALLAPAAALNEPAAHAVQVSAVVAPCVVLKRPAVQTWQEDCPSSVLNVPGSQNAQADSEARREAGVARPGGQAEQWAAAGASL